MSCPSLIRLIIVRPWVSAFTLQAQQITFVVINSCQTDSIQCRYRESAEKNLPFSGFASSQTVPEPAGRAEKMNMMILNQQKENLKHSNTNTKLKPAKTIM